MARACEGVMLPVITSEPLRTAMTGAHHQGAIGPESGGGSPSAAHNAAQRPALDPSQADCDPQTMKAHRGRPLGEISIALLAAAQAGPATLVQLAHRAQVSYDAARFKVSYLVRVGALEALTSPRPRLYTLPSADVCTPLESARRAWLARTREEPR